MGADAYRSGGREDPYSWVVREYEGCQERGLLPDPRKSPEQGLFASSDREQAYHGACLGRTGGSAAQRAARLLPRGEGRLETARGCMSHARPFEYLFFSTLPKACGPEFIIPFRQRMELRHGE